METKRIVVVGGGPAGMMAAVAASQLHQDVTLVERNPILGKKLLLGGKGRCNLTNACGLDLFLKRFSRSGQFLRDAFKKFFNTDLMNFFESRGLKLKVERQQRVFPVTDRADSVVNVLKRELARNKVKIIYNARLKDIIIRSNRVKGVLTEGGKVIPADSIILATGGVSFASSGSSGDGLEIAAKLGHKITALRPGLVPLETRQQFVRSLQGLTLKNIRVSFSDARREITSEVGELLFTGFGISGPLVLSLSGQVADWLGEPRPCAQGRGENKQVYARIDLKPGLSIEQLNARLLREFKESPKKSIRNILKTLLPLRLIDVFLMLVEIKQEKTASQITQGERRRIVLLLKSLRLDILRLRPIAEAMVTRGGVSLKEIDPRTMESRILKGLYLAGEMIDIDADTGGFNLQAAFSTGYLAGESAAG